MKKILTLILIIISFNLSTALAQDVQLKPIELDLSKPQEQLKQIKESAELQVEQQVELPKLQPAEPKAIEGSVEQKTNAKKQSNAIPRMIEFAHCNKYFKLDSTKLFYLTLASINANLFEINEIQSKSGYIIFTANKKQFLASIIPIDKENSILKITPCDNNYYFSIDIVKNLFKYIELNFNTKIEKLN